MPVLPQHQEADEFCDHGVKWKRGGVVIELVGSINQRGEAILVCGHLLMVRRCGAGS